MDNPVVSIVIPVYNGSNYLRDAIDSALAQTYPHCEVIVVNDGSSDGGATAAIAGSYGGKIRYFAKDNGGVATAVNLGVRNMRGEYFSWLSHDDAYYPDKIGKQVAALRSSPDRTAIVHSNLDYVFARNNKIVPMDYLRYERLESLTNGNYAAIFFRIHGCSVLVHKSHFDRVGLYDESKLTTQDSWFLFHAMRGRRSLFVPDRLLMARIHDQQGQKVMTRHEVEYNEMLIDFCRMTGEEEMVRLCGSVLQFYYKMYALHRFKRTSSAILAHVRERLRLLTPAVNPIAGFARLRALLSRRGGPAFASRKICIFGAGMTGKRIRDFLQGMFVRVDCFLDNDPDLIGAAVEGLPCRSVADLSGRNDEWLAVMAIADSADPLAQLRAAGLECVVPMEEMVELMAAVVPPGVFGGMEEMAGDSGEMGEIVGRIMR
ncbi:MAG: glycosyltransferase [Planctomycetota bacterium]|jgi:glycosyltransferase involved in cell wall biosynthesis|nr:glycosyltransferase [Planctomycetota bacterium]